MGLADTRLAPALRTAVLWHRATAVASESSAPQHRAGGAGERSGSNGGCGGAVMRVPPCALEGAEGPAEEAAASLGMLHRHKRQRGVLRGGVGVWVGESIGVSRRIAACRGRWRRVAKAGASCVWSA